MRRCGWIALSCLLCVTAASCFQDIQAPECDSLSSCPVGLGYASCESGLCFVSGRCDHAQPVSGDDCCPRVEGDRTADADCTLIDVPIGWDSVSVSAGDGAGTVWVAGSALDGGGTMRVMVRQVMSDGRLSAPLVVGAGKTTLPPVLTDSGFAYVAIRDGVVRMRARDLSIEQVIPSGAPIGGLAVARLGDAGNRIAWPTADGDVVVFDETSGTRHVLEGIGGVVADRTAFPPFVSQDGARAAFHWRLGALAIVALDGEAPGLLASGTPVPVGAAQPVLVGERGVLVGSDHRLRGLAAESGAFRVAWTVEPGGTIAGPPILAGGDRVAVPMQNGIVALVDGRDGSRLGTADFGLPLADRAVLRLPSGRLVAIGADGRTIRSLVPVGGPEAMVFTGGLWFQVAADWVTDLTQVGDRLYGWTSEGRLGAWWIPEGAVDRAR